MNNRFSFRSPFKTCVASRASLLARSLAAVLSLALVTWLPERLSAAEAGQIFATPEAAVAALSAAVSTTNRIALGTLFGPAAEQLVNPDEVQGASELEKFTEAFSAAHQLVRQSETKVILNVGTNDWPFPIPLVKSTNGWQFDTEAGLDEILNRRIGRNELEVLNTLRACVEAQRDYASKDRDGDEVLEYAQKFASSEGKTDGLYWPTELNDEVSPLGPMVADAQGEGYFSESSKTKTDPQPFHGYLFKMLTRQGKHAPGDKYDYIINGNMIGGFAFVAWPAAYGDSGVMTFIVNQQGRVFQKDLGKGTTKVASKMTTYDPDPSWKLSPD